jgi:hypothetical protein
MDDNSSSSVGILTVVLIVFIILKFLNIIKWSWWAVLIPLWIEIILWIIYVIALLILKHFE